METPTFRFAIAATFTAEPVESVLSFWGRRLDLDVEVRFAPYNQVSQTLLDPSGEFANNRRGVNAILVRIEDLAQFDRHDPATLGRIQSNLRALLDLVRAASAYMSVPLVFVVCPSSAEFMAGAGRARFVREMTDAEETVFDDSTGIQSLIGDEIERLYPVFEKHSPEGERLGRIPYTDLYFCALGTALVRLTHGLVHAAVQGDCARLRQHAVARHLRRGRAAGNCHRSALSRVAAVYGGSTGFGACCSPWPARTMSAT